MNSADGAGFLQQRFQLAVAIHLHRIIAAVNELTVYVEL